jgi:hypothetical protein
MNIPAVIALLLGIAGGGTVMQSTVTQVIVRDELIVRVPVRPMPQNLEWEEHKGPKCVATADIRAAMLSGPQQVDFLLRDRTRIRAKFDDDCRKLDYYDGFYLSPGDDELCAKRDSVHSRMGGSCRIERFRTVTPKVKD